MLLFWVSVNLLALATARKKDWRATEPYGLLYRHGRVRGGFVGFWNEDKHPEPETQLSPDADPHLKIKWFQQRLNHFDGSDTRTWAQKYWVNDRFYKPGGPVFLLIGGEGPTSRHWIDTNEGTPDWLKNAQIFKALCFQLEHRYYGESHPREDMNTENLQWLSSRQALADVAEFIQVTTQTYNLTGPKWITFGGSYSGALSGWFRLKYPQLVSGAVATSAPVLAQVDFKEYLGVVRASLATFSDECVENIASATKKVYALMQTEDGRKTLKQKLKLCSPINASNKLDEENLYSTLAGNFMGVVQYSKDNRGVYANELTIPRVCSLMVNRGLEDVLDRYAAVNKLILDVNREPCLSFRYADFLRMLRNTSFAQPGTSWRLWTYQTCSEFGYYQSSDYENQPFGHQFPLSFSLRQCADIFGPEFTHDFIYKSVNETNLYYGGLDFRGSKVVLPNGSIDPWHALGLLRDPNPESEALYIFGTAHCADMYPPRSLDSPQLRFARQQITAKIRLWLQS